MIVVRHLEQRYVMGEETIHALDDVSLEITPGEYQRELLVV